MPELVWKLVTEADFKAAQELSDELTHISADAKLSATDLATLEKNQDELNAAMEHYVEANKSASISAETLAETKRKLIELDKEHAALLDDMADAGQKSFPAGSLAVLDRNSPEIEQKPVEKLAPATDETKRYEDALRDMYYTQAASALEQKKSADARIGLTAVTRELQQVENELASTNDKTLSGLSPLTQAFIKEEQAVKKSADAMGTKRGRIVAMRQALMPLASEVPGLGNALSIFGGQFTALAAPILIATAAIKQAVDAHQQYEEILKRFDTGATKRFTSSADAIRTSLSEMARESAVFERELIKQESALQRATTALDAMEQVAASRDKRDQNLENSRRRLEMVKFRQKEKDPIKQAEGLLAIEEKYERARIAREDNAARRKATTLSSKQGGAMAESQSALERSVSQEAVVEAKAIEAAKASTRYKDAQQAREDAKKQLEDARKALKEFKTQGLLGAPSLANAVGVSNDPEDIANAIRNGATKFGGMTNNEVAYLPGDFERISGLIELIDSAENAVKASKGAEASAFAQQEKAAADLADAKAALTQFRTDAKEAAKQAKTLGEQLETLQTILKDEAAIRRQSFQIETIAKREELLTDRNKRLGEATVAQAKGEASDVNLKTESAAMKRERARLDASEKAPLNTGELWKSVPKINPQLEQVAALQAQQNTISIEILQSIVQQMTGMKLSLSQLQKQIQNTR